MICNNEPYIYVDETSFNLTNLSTKTWQRKADPIYAPRNVTQLKSITIYGCIGHPRVLARPILMIGSKTEGTEYMDFLNVVMS